MTRLRPHSPTKRSLLIKGSRFMRMERVVESVVAHNPSPKEHPHAA